jgi:hypothetical protein
MIMELVDLEIVDLGIADLELAAEVDHGLQPIDLEDDK